MTEETAVKKTRRVFITCKTIKKIGIDSSCSDETEGRTTEIGEVIKLTKDAARKLQKAGAIQVEI